VVCYDQNNKKVRLSLRQADILAALATDEKLLAEGGGVPDVQTGDTKYVRSNHDGESILTTAEGYPIQRQSFTLSSGALCSRQPLENHGVLASRTF
jgi:hypothetical protein